MKKKKSVYIISVPLLLVILFSCTFQNSKNDIRENNKLKTNSTNLVVLNLETEGEKQKVYLQDIADVEYIPLETTDKVLLESANKFVLTEKHILAFNQKEGSIFIFDRQGKIKHHFKRLGGGPEEYQRCSKVTLDDELQEVYVADDIRRQQIIVYDFDGNFKRSIRIPFMPIQVLMNIDENNLFHFDTSALLHFPKKDTIGNYRFINKTDGKLTALPIRPEQELTTSMEDKEGRITSSIMYNYLKNGEEVILADFATDTIYSLKNKELTPIAMKTPSPLQMTPPVLMGLDMKTNRYLFLTIRKKMFDSNNKPVPGRLLTYDLMEHKALDLKIINKDYPGKKKQFQFLNGMMEINIKNCGVVAYPAYMLTQALEEGKLIGKLKEIASTLKEDDNPVLMLAKFKE